MKKLIALFAVIAFVATAAKKPAKLAALKKNAAVTVEYTAAGKVLSADSIKL